MRNTVFQQEHHDRYLSVVTSVAYQKARDLAWILDASLAGSLIMFGIVTNSFCRTIVPLCALSKSISRLRTLYLVVKLMKKRPQQRTARYDAI